MQGYKGSMLKVGGKNGKSATVSELFVFIFIHNNRQQKKTEIKETNLTT